MSKVKLKVKSNYEKKAPIISGLSKSEVRMWIAFCKSVNQNLNTI